jgi:Ca-activated chloride channel family protein
MIGHFSFDHLWVLTGFLLFIPVILIWVIRFRSFSRTGLGGKSGKIRFFLSNLFFWIFLACIIIALSGPRWGIAPGAKEFRRGLDVVFAVDVSRSMEVTDVTPSGVTRLERGLAIAKELVSAAPEVRYGAAISRGKGLVTVPLTWDTEAISSFLEGLNGSPVSGRGTDLESLLDSASSAFQDSSPAKRVIIFISDGEALSGSLSNALDRRAGEGVIIVSLVLGTDEGGLVPNKDAGSADFDEYQDEIISRRDSTVMHSAANRTGGIYIEGNGDKTVSQIAVLLADYFTSLASESESPGGKQESKSRWQIFIAAAIAAYGVSKLCLLRRRKQKENGQ